jgi:hypothetical protein
MVDVPSDPLPSEPAAQSTAAPGKGWRGTLLSRIRDDEIRYGHDRSRHAAEMQKRLADPQSREQLRVEQRDLIHATLPGLAQVLDPQAASALIELLTDQHLAHLDRVWVDEVRATNPVAMKDRAARSVEEGARRIEEIRNLLGEHRFERYRDYQETLREGLEVALFEERLQPGNELTSDQKDRLMALLRQRSEEQTRWHMLESRDLFVPPPLPPADREELRKRSIATSEKSYWRMQEEGRLFVGKLPAVLTQGQIEVFAQMEAERIAGHRERVEQMRVDAGMSREFLAPARTDEGPGRQLMRGPVRLEVSLQVDGNEPVMLCLLTQNEKAVSFEGPQSLSVEATPTVFDDGWAYVKFDFFEHGEGRGRAARGSMSVGMQTRRQRPLPLGATRSGASISGRKVYAIELDARLVPVE